MDNFKQGGQSGAGCAGALRQRSAGPDPPGPSRLADAAIQRYVQQVCRTRGLVKGLREAGYIEGREYEFVSRSADGDLRKLRALAREIGAEKVDVLFPRRAYGRCGLVCQPTHPDRNRHRHRPNRGRLRGFAGTPGQAYHRSYHRQCRTDRQAHATPHRTDPGNRAFGHLHRRGPARKLRRGTGADGQGGHQARPNSGADSGRCR